MEKQKRFSKTKICETLEFHINCLATAYGFTTDNGWDQVRNKDIETILDYGRWKALREILSGINSGEF